MHPTICQKLVWAQIADLHQQAARERTAHAASHARRTHKQPVIRSVPRHAVNVLTRLIFTLPGARRPSPTR